MKTWNRKLENNLLIIDASNLCYRWFKSPLNMPNDFLSTIASFKNTYSSKDVVVLFDNGASDYRKNLLDTYKSNRKKERTPEEEAHLKVFYDKQRETKELLVSSGYCVISLKGLESDDVASYLKVLCEPTHNMLYMISADYDWLQLLSDKTHIYSFTQNSYRDLSWLDATMSCTPLEFMLAKCLSGDAGDGVTTGIKGFGEPKKESSRSLKYARGCKTVEDIIEVAKKAKGVLASRVVDNIDTLRFNQKIMGLLDPLEIITVEYQATIKKELKTNAIQFKD